MHILLIEDDPSVANFVEKGFIDKGHIVTHAATGVDGLGLAKDEDYDAIIVDRMLPELDGLSIIEALRNEKDNTPIHIKGYLVNVKSAHGAGDYFAGKFLLDFINNNNS